MELYCKSRQTQLAQVTLRALLKSLISLDVTSSLLPLIENRINMPQIPSELNTQVESFFDHLALMEPLLPSGRYGHLEMALTIWYAQISVSYRFASLLLELVRSVFPVFSSEDRHMLYETLCKWIDSDIKAFLPYAQGNLQSVD
ncbi:hypothetical protein HDU97_004640 [Phlyctochytrium planicorne]|nr:hypothetical protein HDU97_004640 [Phlyctochytrium planicorne]